METTNGWNKIQTEMESYGFQIQAVTMTPVDVLERRKLSGTNNLTE